MIKLEIDKSGKRFWYWLHHYHRLNGPAIQWMNGYQSWYKKGKRHRDNGPAVVYSSGSCEWYRDGLLHRDGGPARYNEYYKSFEYWIKGQQVTEFEHMFLSESVLV